MDPYLIPVLARERQREARHEAATARLAAIARCCKPSELSRLLRALRAKVVREPACC